MQALRGPASYKSGELRWGQANPCPTLLRLAPAGDLRRALAAAERLALLAGDAERRDLGALLLHAGRPAEAAAELGAYAASAAGRAAPTAERRLVSARGPFADLWRAPDMLMWSAWLWPSSQVGMACHALLGTQQISRRLVSPAYSSSSAGLPGSAEGCTDATGLQCCMCEKDAGEARMSGLQATILSDRHVWPQVAELGQSARELAGAAGPGEAQAMTLASALKHMPPEVDPERRLPLTW